MKEEIKDCPFCGSSAEIKQTGKLELTLRCGNCLIGIKQKVLRQDLDWLKERMILGWNMRV